MAKFLKVAMVEPVGGHGGCTYYDFSLCRSLSMNSVIPILYTCDKTEVTGREGFRIERSYVRIYGADSALVRGLRFIRGSLTGLIGARFSGAKIAHFHFFHVGPLEFFNVVLARALLMRVVITAHDVEAFKEGLSVKKFVHWAYGLAHAVIAHNQVSKNELLSHVGVQESLVHIIKHGNHAEYIRQDVTREQARHRLGIDDDVFSLVFFGQIKEVKGVDILLRAMPMVRAKIGSRLRLVIAGKVWKDDFSKYQRLIDDLDLKDCIDLHIRYIPDDELPYFYAAADLMSLPYKRIYQSGVVLMAMSFGRPVLVSDIPGMTEVVTHGLTGLVFRSEDPSDMAEKIINAYEDPLRLQSIAENGRKLMDTDYAWSRIGKVTADVYRNIL